MMKPLIQRHMRLVVGLLLAEVVLHVQESAGSTSNIWSVATTVTGLWSTASNWTPNAVPNGVDAAVVGNTPNYAASCTILDQAATVGLLTAGENRGSWLILATNANALTVQAASGTAMLYSGYRANLTVNPNIVMNSSLLVSNKSDTACSITLNGAIGGTGDLAIAPNGNYNSSTPRETASFSNINMSGAIYVRGWTNNDVRFYGSIGANVTKLDLTANGSNSTVMLASTNAYGGDTVLPCGTLFFGKATSLSTGMLIVSGGTVQATANLSGINAISNALRACGNFTVSGASNLEFAGSVDLNGGARQITVSSTGTNTISGVIGGTAGSKFVKAGTGAQLLARPNTYPAGTTVLGGMLKLTNNATLGYGSVTVSAITNAVVKLDLSGLTNAVDGYVSAIAKTAMLTLNSTNILTTNYYPNVAFGVRGFTNQVAALILDGVKQSNNLYTSNNLPLYITGAGAIRVTGAVSGTAVLIF